MRDGMSGQEPSAVARGRRAALPCALALAAALGGCAPTTDAPAPPGASGSSPAPTASSATPTPPVPADGDDGTSAIDPMTLWSACRDRLVTEYPDLDPTRYWSFEAEQVSAPEDGAAYVSIPWGTLDDGRPEAEYNCSFSGLPDDIVIDWVGPTDI